MKNIENFSKEVAQSRGLSEELVLKINNYFWRYGIRRNLTELNHNSVYIKNLGSINISRYKLNKEILKTIQQLRIARSSDKFKQETKDRVVLKLETDLRLLLITRNRVAINLKNQKCQS